MSETLIQEAIAFANAKHMNQTRKDGTPYIWHPLRVAIRVKEAGYGEKYQLVAILHDTLEDTDATQDEIRYFGEDVLEAVVKLSKNYMENVPSYFEGILANPMAKAVKEADRMDNINDSVNAGDKKFISKYLKESKEYFFGRFSPELDKRIIEYEEYVNTQILNNQ